MLTVAPTSSQYKQHGALLVALMIGVMVGLVVLIGGLNFYLIVIRNYAGMVHDARLAREISGTLTFIADELRRTGYHALITLQNPFTEISTDLAIQENGNCILYTYDRNENGLVDPQEFFGFRLRNERIETRVSGITTLDCEDGNWSAITDSRITRMTDLIFEEGTYSCLNTHTGTQWESRCDDSTASGYEVPSEDDPLNEIRRVSVYIAGTLANDNYLNWQQYQQTIQLRNHRLIIAAEPE